MRATPRRECSMIHDLEANEIDNVNGGWFWLVLPVIIGAGYTVGKDRAERDNKRDEKKAN